MQKVMHFLSVGRFFAPRGEIIQDHCRPNSAVVVDDLTQWCTASPITSKMLQRCIFVRDCSSALEKMTPKSCQTAKSPALVTVMSFCVCRDREKTSSTPVCSTLFGGTSNVLTTPSRLPKRTSLVQRVTAHGRRTLLSPTTRQGEQVSLTS